MSEAPDKPEDQASGQPQSDEEERSPLRKVPEDELQEILVAHETWVQSEGKEGNRLRTNVDQLRNGAPSPHICSVVKT